MVSSDDKIRQETQDAKRLFNIWPVYEYFLQKFRSADNPKKLSLHEDMIPLEGCQKFRTCNPGKIT